MPLAILRRPAARVDLIDLWNYVADADETAADRILDRIESVLALIAENPMMGRSRPDVSPGLRSFVVGNYVIFYRIHQDTVVLTRVLSAYRDIDAMEFE